MPALCISLLKIKFLSKLNCIRGKDVKCHLLAITAIILNFVLLHGSDSIYGCCFVCLQNVLCLYKIRVGWCKIIIMNFCSFCQCMCQMLKNVVIPSCTPTEFVALWQRKWLTSACFPYTTFFYAYSWRGYHYFYNGKILDQKDAIV